MANGVKVWDSLGSVILDTSDRSFTIIGKFTYTFSGETGNVSGSISAPDASRGTPGFFVVENPKVISTLGDYIAPVTITISGTTFNWLTGTSFGNFQVGGKLTFLYGYF